MREIRQSGSEGGEAGNLPAFPTRYNMPLHALSAFHRLG